MCEWAGCWRALSLPFLFFPDPLALRFLGCYWLPEGLEDEPEELVLRLVFPLVKVRITMLVLDG